LVSINILIARTNIENGISMIYDRLLNKQSLDKFRVYETLIYDILKTATNGVTKKQIMEDFSLSKPQLRRLTAELLSKDLLRYHLNLGLLMTSAKGNLYLKKNAVEIPSVSLKLTDIARETISLDYGRTLLDARNFMLRYNISRIAISHNGKTVGIITEKDIARYLYDNPPTKRLSEVALKEFVRKKLITVNENSSIGICSILMLKHGISSLIVVDKEGKDKGIITKTDLIEYYAYHQTVRILVHDCMSKKVHSVAPDETIHTIAMLMTSHKISRVVVEKNKKPIGIVTSRDFLPVSLIHGTGSLGYWTTRADMILIKRHQRFIPSGMMAVVLAQDIMTSSPIMVRMNTDIAEAARVMIGNRISGLPVISKKGYLIGIITKTDILKNQIVTPIDFGIG
jgi:CBS domain-containing protein/predicted transcriptional regulator